jgi:hypothetical protein
MRIGRYRGKIVDTDHLDVLPVVLHNGTQDVPADASKAVDCDTNCHPGLLHPSPAWDGHDA